MILVRNLSVLHESFHIFCNEIQCISIFAPGKFIHILPDCVGNFPTKFVKVFVAILAIVFVAILAFYNLVLGGCLPVFHSPFSCPFLFLFHFHHVLHLSPGLSIATHAFFAWIKLVMACLTFDSIILQAML